MAVLAEIGSSILLYFLVFGMSATVDIRRLRKQLRNRNALLTGVSLQFVILPFLGFVVVKVLRMSAPMGISLLVVTSSPGGSYSNWWCSIFNAELALSVTMTTISTLLSIIMLPVNLVLYVTTTYSNEVVETLDWTALFVSLVVVIGGISTGLICSATVKNPRFNLLANKLGNVAGIALVTFSVVVSSGKHGGELWNQEPFFYFGVGLPCLVGLLVATWMVSYFKLDKPERVAVAVECCYQNTGIATSVAAAIFEGDDLAVAIGVPLFYGICEAVFLAIYCVVCWKLGWTKAPADESICKVITTSYEVKEMMGVEPEAIEVVLGEPGKDGAQIDMIFRSTKEGLQIDEQSLESLTEHARKNSSDFSIEDVGTEDSIGDDNVSEEPNPRQDGESKKRRRSRKYSSVKSNSPNSKDAVAGPSPRQSAKTDDRVGGNVVSRTISSLRARAASSDGGGVGKYSKAKPTQGEEEDAAMDGTYNFSPSRIQEPIQDHEHDII